MFGRRIEIFRIFGFPIRVDASWLVILFMVIYSLAGGYFPVNQPGMPVTAYWAMAFVAAVGLFLSILFHELSHSLVGRHYHLAIDGITLFIFGGVAEMREEAASPRVEFLMSVVGPVASGVLGLLFFFLQHLVDIYQVNRGLQLIFYYLGFMNFLLAGFNLIPAFPLDGGRMFRALLWGIKKDYAWATRVAARIGWGFGWLLIGYGAYSLARGNAIGGIWYVMIGFFLKRASKSSEEQVVLKQKLEDAPISALMQTQFLQFQPEDRLEDLSLYFNGMQLYSHYPVIDAGQLVGYLSLARLNELNRDMWRNSRVADLLERDLGEVSIDVSGSAWQALEAMKSKKLFNLFVTSEGRMRGLVTIQDLLAFVRGGLNEK